jgi:hypothetical protein
VVGGSPAPPGAWGGNYSDRTQGGGGKMKRNGSREELLSWFKINMENTQNLIIDLNIAIHNLKTSGKDDLNLDHTLRMSERYLKNYLQDQEEEYSGLLKNTKQSIIKMTPAKIFQFKKK